MLQLLLLKDPLDTCLQRICFAAFSTVTLLLPAWAWPDPCGSLPGVRVPDVSGDTGTGAIRPSVLPPAGFPNCPRVPKPPQGPDPGSQNRPGVPKPPRVPPASSLLSARAQLGQQGAEPGLALSPATPGPRVGPRASPAGRGRCRLLTGDLGLPRSPACVPMQRWEPTAITSFLRVLLWGFVTHDVSHLGFDQLVGMVLLFPCQAVAFLPPAVSGLAAIVWLF